MAASFNKLDKSAPEKPGVLLAIVSMSTSPSNLLFVETSRTQQRRIENVRSVRRRNYNDASVTLETIHFSQQLVQRLLSFVVTAANAGTSGSTDGIDFIDENDARRVLLRFLEQVSHSRGTHANKHFDKLGTGDGKEWDAGFTRDGLGEQSLTGAWRTDEQNAFRDLRADGGKSFRLLQKLDNFHEILLGFVDTGNVVERHARVRFHLKLGFRLTKRHRVVSTHAPRHARSTTGATGSSGEQK